MTEVKHNYVLKPAAGTLRVAKKHRPQQHRRIMRGGAGLVVAVVGIEDRQVDLVDQMMQCMGERTRHQLRFKVHRQQPRTHIDMLVARHSQTLAA